jgi:hypothetical protein
MMFLVNKDVDDSNDALKTNCKLRDRESNDVSQDHGVREVAAGAHVRRGSSPRSCMSICCRGKRFALASCRSEILTMFAIRSTCSGSGSCWTTSVSESVELSVLNFAFATQDRSCSSV